METGNSIGSQHGYGASQDQKAVEYYERIRESCPYLEELDDEPVSPEFYQIKIDGVKNKTNHKSGEEGVGHLSFMRRFEGLGLTKAAILEATSDQIERIDNEEDEEMLLITTIKTQTPEQKARRDFELYSLNLDDKPARPRSGQKIKIKKSELSKFRNTTQGFGLGKSSQHSRENSQVKGRDPMRESSMYFLKHAFSNQTSNNFGEDGDDFLTTFKKNSMAPSTGGKTGFDKSFDEATEPSRGFRGTMSLLKSRRLSSKLSL